MIKYSSAYNKGMAPTLKRERFLTGHLFNSGTSLLEDGPVLAYGLPHHWCSWRRGKISRPSETSFLTHPEAFCLWCWCLHWAGSGDLILCRSDWGVPQFSLLLNPIKVLLQVSTSRGSTALAGVSLSPRVWLPSVHGALSCSSPILSLMTGSLPLALAWV